MKHIFIINPKAGKEDVSLKINQYISNKPGLEALVFTSEHCGHETELTKQLCGTYSDEIIRIYACGGSGTLCRVISGITSFENVEIACYPAGMTNDLLKVFEGGANAFKNIDALVGGDIMKLDVLDFGLGRAMNSLSSGVDAKIGSTVNKLSFLAAINNKLPYKLAVAINLLKPKTRAYNIKVDGKDYSGKYMIAAALNGVCYGGTHYPVPYARPNDGKFDYIMYTPKSLMKTKNDLKYFARGELEALRSSIKVLSGREVSLSTVHKRKNLIVNADGEIYVLPKNNANYQMQLLPGALKFVVPKGVKIKPYVEGKPVE